jgi:hypothetical protein
VGFLDRLFARHGSQEEVDIALYEGGRRDPETDPRPWDGRRNISVVGESNYQPALRKVSGAPASGEWSYECSAQLIPEPTNPHDPKAVMVQVDGECVGYLSRHNARVFGPRILEIGEVVCEAFIGRGPENPNLGVRLHLPKDHPIFVPLSKS